METNITEQEFLVDDLPIAEPHFDEESTVLSARPVVPLKKVPANARFTRPWIFGLALAGALLFGISATAVYYSRLNRNEFNATVNAETISADAQPGAPEANNPDDLPPSGSDASVDSEASPIDALPKEKSVQPVVSLSTKPAKSSRDASRKPRRAVVAVVDEDSDREIENREERRAARREAKQRIRQMRRERRVGRSTDDLLRIRDIFEGTPRP